MPGSALTVRLSQAQVSGFWALRLAGRFRVNVASWPACDSSTLNPATAGISGG
ncbi:MAG TPA: hypothetical protein VF542_09545 [Jatrophihabitans sp.]